MGERDAYAQASSLLETHRRNLREGMKFLQANMQDFGKFYFLDARGIIPDTIIGVVAGMGLPPFAKKPIFAVATDDAGNIKVSARANASLVKAGLNLGKVQREAAGRCAGAGGGHRIAAGASIPKGGLECFLLELNKLL
jgi:RecJ-like exonuclease